MNLQELRHENWVNFEGVELQIGMLDLDIARECCPILLTEEWVLKLGYIKENGLSNFKKGKFNIFKGKTGLSLLGIEEDEDYWNFSNRLWNINKKIKYVHSLQNLEFELTKNE